MITITTDNNNKKNNNKLIRFLPAAGYNYNTVIRTHFPNTVKRTDSTNFFRGGRPRRPVASVGSAQPVIRAIAIRVAGAAESNKYQCLGINCTKRERGNRAAIVTRPGSTSAKQARDTRQSVLNRRTAGLDSFLAGISHQKTWAFTCTRG